MSKGAASGGGRGGRAPLLYLPGEEWPSVKAFPDDPPAVRGTAPDGWWESYKAIRKVRMDLNAPVDTMGAATLGRAKFGTPDFRYQVLVGLMLSPQTRDEKTYEASQNLLHHGIVSAATMDAAELAEVEALIKSVSFYRNKAKALKDMARRVNSGEWGGDIPNTLAGLKDLKGVGPKIAALALQTAWGTEAADVSIGVDVHLHNVSNRLGWVDDGISDDAARRQLESWLPIELWAEVNPLFVGFGQTICEKKAPRCSECPLVATCPSSNPSTKVGKKRRTAAIPPPTPPSSSSSSPPSSKRRKKRERIEPEYVEESEEAEEEEDDKDEGFDEDADGWD